MIKIGITGGIGSGKSTICRMFELLGVAVFNADSEAKQLMNNDPALRRRITELFGTESYHGGQLNREWIASRVFGNSTLIEQLNHAVHPTVARAFEEWANHQNGHYVIEEAAILFESGADRMMDKTVTVSSPEQMRLQRTCLRDHATPEEVRRRMAAQMSDAQREARADYVIVSDETTPVIEQVLALHEIFNRL